MTTAANNVQTSTQPFEHGMAWCVPEEPWQTVLPYSLDRFLVVADSWYFLGWEFDRFALGTNIDVMKQRVVFQQFQGVLALVLWVLTMQFVFSHLSPPHRMGRILWFRRIHRNHHHSFCRLVWWPRCTPPGSLVSRCRMTSLLHRKDPFHAIKKPTF